MTPRLRVASIPVLALALALLAAGCGTSSDPAAPAGGPFTVDAGGGSGTATTGGSGDYSAVIIESYGPRGIEIRRTGKANAGFTLNVPASTPNFGAEPLAIATDCTIQALATQPTDNVERYYLGPGPTGDTLYHQYSDVRIVAVTGLRVGAGARLTLALHRDEDFSGRSDSARLELNNDLEVLGTLCPAAFDCAATQDSGNPADRGGLIVLTKGGIFIRSGGLVTTAGGNVASGNGGHAGRLAMISNSWDVSQNGGLLVNAGAIDVSGGSTTDNTGNGGSAATFGSTSYPADVYISSLGYLVNTGTIRANGGNGGNLGGLARSLILMGDSHVYNTGPVSADGGGGASCAYGQAGGSVWIGSVYASLYNSGAVSASGAGGRETGGDGGQIFLGLNGETGRVLNSGALAANAGDSRGTDNATAHAAGSGGSIRLVGFGGDLRTSGEILARGGSNADNNPSSTAGSGGRIEILAQYGYDWNGESQVPPGDLEISGNLAASGGSGAAGGGGGQVYIGYAADSYWEYGSVYAPPTGGVRMLGYEAVRIAGGNGATDGGSGGGIGLRTGSVWAYEGLYLPVGPIANEADILGSGGNGGTGSGGYGAYVTLMTTDPYEWQEYYVPDSPVRPTFSNSGAVDTTGGDGAARGGDGGEVEFWSIDDLRNSGAIDASGGANRVDNTSVGGNGGNISLRSPVGNVASSGNIASNGGRGVASGGQGAIPGMVQGIRFMGQHVSLSGTIRADGGSVDYTARQSGALAGNGGWIFALSYSEPTAVACPLLSVARGAGGDPDLTAPAANGHILVDLVDVTPSDGTLP